MRAPPLSSFASPSCPSPSWSDSMRRRGARVVRLPRLLRESSFVQRNERQALEGGEVAVGEDGRGFACRRLGVDLAGVEDGEGVAGVGVEEDLAAGEQDPAVAEPVEQARLVEADAGGVEL